MEYNLNNPLFVGKFIIELSHVNSTNDYALALIKDKKPAEGTIISTTNQLKGKGQYGRKWEGSKGMNITESIILYPNYIKADRSFLLNQAISIGIFNFTAKYVGDKLSIKWPNDIYYKKSKLAGILIENTISNNNISSSVVGIGINVNQTDFSGAPNPTSLKLIAGRNYNLKALKKELSYHIEKQIVDLKAGKWEGMQQNYLRSLFQFGKTCRFKTPDGIIRAKITGINSEGKLILNSEGKMLAFNNNEAAML